MEGGCDAARSWWKPLSGTLCHQGRGHVFMGSADGDPRIGVPGASRMAKAAQLGHSVAEMRAIGGAGGRQAAVGVTADVLVVGESKGVHVPRVSLLLQVADQLCAKYSKEYGKLCRTNQIGTVNDRVMTWWNRCSQLELAEQTCLLWLSAPFSCGQWLMPVAHCRVGGASCAAGGRPALEHGSVVLRSLAGEALLCWL